MEPDCIIVGGGVSGLSLGFDLQQLGRQVVVLENEEAPGGTLRSTRRDGLILEWGCNAFVDREPKMRELVERLGIQSKLRPAAPDAKTRWVLHQGRLVALPRSPKTLLTSPLLSAKGKLRLLGEPLTPRGNADDESLGDFARRHLGREAALVLVDALQTGTFAGDLEALSAHAAFPLFRELESNHRSLLFAQLKRARAAGPPRTGPLTSFEGGMGTLAEALAGALGNGFRPGAHVESLGRHFDKWEVRFTGKSGSGVLRARTLVLATPAFAASALLEPLHPKLSDALKAIPYAPIAAVHLGFDDAAVPQPSKGFGYIAPAHLRRPVLGTLYVSDVFPWRAREGLTLVTCMMGGALQPSMLEHGDDALFNKAREELAKLLHIVEPPRFQQLVRWPRGIPQYNVGHAERLARIDALTSALPHFHLTGNAYRGVALNDCVREAARLAGEISSHLTAA